jgi:hypothetical protein
MIPKQVERITLPSKSLLQDSIKLCQLTTEMEQDIKDALLRGNYGFHSQVRLERVFFRANERVAAALYTFGADLAVVFRGSQLAPDFLYEHSSKKAVFAELNHVGGVAQVHRAVLEEWREVSSSVSNQIQEWVRGGSMCFRRMTPER